MYEINAWPLNKALNPIFFWDYIVEFERGQTFWISSLKTLIRTHKRELIRKHAYNLNHIILNQRKI
jgi:hypothetical protein